MSSPQDRQVRSLSRELTTPPPSPDALAQLRDRQQRTDRLRGRLTTATAGSATATSAARASR